MDERKYFNKMEQYNNIAHKNKCLYRAETFGNLVSSLLFVLFLLPFIARLFILSEDFGRCFIETVKVREIVVKVSEFLPYLNSDLGIWQFLIYTVIYLFIIPIIAGLMVYFITKIIALKSSPTPLSNNLEENIKKFKNNYWKYRDTANVLPLDFEYDIFNPFAIFTSVIVVLLATFSLSIWDVVILCNEKFIKYTFIDRSTIIVGAVMRGIFRAIGIILCFGVFILLISGLFYGIQKTTIFANKRYYGYKDARDKIEKLEKDIENERKAEKEAQEQAEKAAAEAKAKKEKEERARNAENEFIKINIDGNEDVRLIKKLANEGSASASFYMGKKLYDQYLNEALTNSEKDEMSEKIIKHFETASAKGNIEAKILLLAIRVKSETNTISIWKGYLGEARAYKKSNKISQEYCEIIDELISSLIYTIDNYNEGTHNSYYDYNTGSSYTNNNTSSTGMNGDYLHDVNVLHDAEFGPHPVDYEQVKKARDEFYKRYH